MDEINLRTPAGSRTSCAWTLYEIATAAEPVDRWAIVRGRSLRVGARAIGRHIRELMRAGYIEVARQEDEVINDRMTIATRYYRATPSGLEALRA